MSSTEIQYKRLHFWNLFELNSNGSLTPRKTIRVGGITFGPGVSFSKGVLFSGIDFFKYSNNDIAAVEKDGILEIKGFYSDAK